MSLDWNDLKVFLALERNRSARAAAVSLGSSHSTVLRRLQTLEEALGAQVFDRTPDGLAITGAGERLLVKAQQIEADILEIERDVAQSDVVLKGPVRLTAPPTVLRHLLLPMLMEFRAQFPEISLQVIATDGLSDLDRRDADLAIRFSEEPSAHLVGWRLPEFHDAIYVATDHADRWYQGTMPEWIGWPAEKLFEERIASTPFGKTPVAWRLPGLELQAEAARQGAGMALLPCIMGDKDPGLVRLDRGFTQPTLATWLLRHPDMRRMERVRVFSQFLFDRISAQKDVVAGILHPR